MATAVQDKSIQIEKLELGPYQTNAYILICRQTRDSVLVDAPAEGGRLAAKLRGTKPKYVLITHNHIDHISALAEVQSALKVPVAIHAADAKGLPLVPQILLRDGDTISFGRIKLEVLHTPGHTPGSLCFRAGKYLISGDTVFTAGPGHTSSPAALQQIIKSITEKVWVLPEDTQIFPGHGPVTVLKKEKAEFDVFASRPHDPNLCGDIVWLSS